MLIKLYNPAKGPMRLAIFMSGSGSNAVKILERHAEQEMAGVVTFEPVLMFTDNPDSNAEKISNRFGVPFSLNPIKDFYFERQASLSDKLVRKEYDSVQLNNLRSSNVDAVALAGYDWVISPGICDNFVVVNVPPGDLRTKNADGKRNYVGLSWVPSAKAILNGDKYVYTSVHLVTSGLDEGPLLAVSAPQAVPSEVLGLERKVLLGKADSLVDINAFIRANPSVSYEELARMFPIYGYAKDCQERLKVHGDWIEFPNAIVNISSGSYEKDREGKLYFEGNPIPEGVVREK